MTFLLCSSAGFYRAEVNPLPFQGVYAAGYFNKCRLVDFAVIKDFHKKRIPSSPLLFTDNLIANYVEGKRPSKACSDAA